MIKKMVKVGNSLGILIEKPIMKLLGWNCDEQFSVTTDGTTVFIERVDGVIPKDDIAEGICRKRHRKD